MVSVLHTHAYPTCVCAHAYPTCACTHAYPTRACTHARAHTHTHTHTHTHAHTHTRTRTHTLLTHPHTTHAPTGPSTRPHLVHACILTLFNAPPACLTHACALTLSLTPACLTHAPTLTLCLVPLTLCAPACWLPLSTADVQFLRELHSLVVVMLGCIYNHIFIHPGVAQEANSISGSMQQHTGSAAARAQVGGVWPGCMDAGGLRGVRHARQHAAHKQCGRRGTGGVVGGQGL